MINMTGFENFCETVDQAAIQVLFCERFDEKSDIWNFSRHRHNHIEMLYFLYGNAQADVTDASISASFCDIVIYPKGMYHTEHLQRNQHQEIYCLWVDIPGLEIPRAVHVRDKAMRIRPLLDSLYAEYKAEYPTYALLAHYVKAIAILIARLYFGSNEPERSIDPVIIYMHDSIGKPMMVNELAGLIHVSNSSLNRLFLKHTGLTPMKYLQSIRVEAARMMLADSDMRIWEISDALGFNSPKYFCKVFYQHTGLSPRTFRNDNKPDG